MQEQKVMTQNEMAMAKATGAKVVSMSEQTPEEHFGLSEIRELRQKMSALVSPLNVSHTLAIGWSVADDLRVVEQLMELRRYQLIELEEAHYELKKKIRILGYDPKELG